MGTDTSQGPRTVLIVDDELFFRELLRDILTQGGFTVVAEAANGSEALEKYREFRPAVVVMDIFMPERHGIDATRDIVSFDSAARILVCSGLGYDDDVAAAMQAGARGFILKPFIASEVMDTIQSVLT